MSDYPACVTVLLGEEIAFSTETLQVVREYAASRPWRGTRLEQRQKVRRLYAGLTRAHGVTSLRIVFGGQTDCDSTRSCYLPRFHTVVLRGPRISVVTALHEFGHHLGLDEHGACAYSLQLFRQCFPKSFARCVPDGHMLRARRTT